MVKTSLPLYMRKNLLACFAFGQGIICALPGPGRAQGDLEAIRTIGVYSVVEKGDALAPDFSEFLAGYLDHVKNYAVHNLDEYNLRERFVFSRDDPEAEALGKAAELGADALILARVQGFREYENKGKVRLRLLDVQSRVEMRTWPATIEAPYFDPPQYYSIRPYGNLDEVFAEFPVATYETPVEIRMLVMSDQYLRGKGRRTKDYLMSQLELASRVMEREFGIRLKVERIERWKPPATGIDGIARAAASIPGREQVDLTFVCLSSPAPATYWSGTQVLGYMRAYSPTS